MDQHPERRAEVLKAMGQPTLLRILDQLRDGERCVYEIFPATGGQQSNVSRHPQIVRRAGVLASRKQGLHVMYRITDSKTKKLLTAVNGMFGRSGSGKRGRSSA